VIPGDIAAALGVRASGTWRPAPPWAGEAGSAVSAPGTYATSVPFLIARRSGAEPAGVAAALAARLGGTDWIRAASVTGGGYLTVTVTERALASLAVRVPAAGAGCAASDALRGTVLAAPAVADPASAASWDEAWTLVAAATTGRLATAAGADIAGRVQTFTERSGSPGQPSIAALARFAGSDAIRYALARTTRARAGSLEARLTVQNSVENPFFLVQYAHALAASVLRWATDLGIERGRPEAFQPRRLAAPAELELLTAISWLPERVAAAARRQRPDAFARYLEDLASAWLDCAEGCPALPFGGRPAPRDEPTAAARLWLAAAAQTALGTGLELLGVAAPGRL
jgi:arginyl-tRNA synthetase